MSMIHRALGGTCLALVFAGAAAQTGTTGAPPTHPAVGGDTMSTPSPTTPPTHPAGGTSAATPEAARQQNPVLQSSPSSEDAGRAGDRASSTSGSGSSTKGDRTSRGSTPNDSMPKQPAAESK